MLYKNSTVDGNALIFLQQFHNLDNNSSSCDGGQKHTYTRIRGRPDLAQSTFGQTFRIFVLWGECNRCLVQSLFLHYSE